MEVRPKRLKPPAGERPLFQGTAEQVIADIRAYANAGVTHFVFDFTTQDLRLVLENLERFAQEVRPKLSQVDARTTGLLERGPRDRVRAQVARPEERVDRGVRSQSRRQAARSERSDAARPANASPPGWTMITHAEACGLIEGPAGGLEDLLARAGEVRDRGRGRTVTFSAKVFVPLTTLCRDYCGYCTFRRDPGEPGAHTMTPDEVVALVQAGRAAGRQGGAVLARRQAGGALPRAPRVPRAARARDDAVATCARCAR